MGNMKQDAIWDAEYGGHEMKWKKERLEIPAKLKGKRVLEVGVGNGKNLPEILRQNPKSIHAIDVSKVAVQQCKEQFPHSVLKVEKMSITRTKFKEGSFDVILCYYILNNLLEKDRKKAAAEMQRILAKGGVIVVEDFAAGDLRQKSENSQDIEPGTILRKNGIFCHFFTKIELKELFPDLRAVKVAEKSFHVVARQPDLRRKLLTLTGRKHSIHKHKV